MRRAPSFVISVALLAACSSGSKDAPAMGSGAGSGSGSSYAALGKKPKDARRPTPPPGIEAKALAVGAKAPDITLTDVATGSPWKLSDALSKHARVMLVFYRGDW